MPQPQRPARSARRRQWQIGSHLGSNRGRRRGNRGRDIVVGCDTYESILHDLRHLGLIDIRLTGPGRVPLLDHPTGPFQTNSHDILLQEQGTTDWASDLQKYNPVPSPSKDWNAFKLAIRSNLDPKGDDGVRDSNSTKLTCDNDYTINWNKYTPEKI
ncbi:hypothetical protein N0V85_004195 [Neurospora sp. IMI 360204]|nr:hypothetical protein N0V85_004195 [Neurospora sp. IMI 360204]